MKLLSDRCVVWSEQRWNITVDNRFSTAGTPSGDHPRSGGRRRVVEAGACGAPTHNSSWRSFITRDHPPPHHLSGDSAASLWRSGCLTRRQSRHGWGGSPVPRRHLAADVAPPPPVARSANLPAGDGPWTYLLSLLNKPYNNGPTPDSNQSRDLRFESQELDFPGINIPTL